MANQSIRASVDYFLATGQLDRGGRERIGAESKEDEEKAGADEELADPTKGEWRVGPTAAVVKCGEDEDTEEGERGNGLDDLLDELLFGDRPGLDAAHEKRGIVDH